MAAEVIAKAGLVPHIFDAMPTPARKLLMAGKSGLNLTHGEDLEVFLTRYSPMPTFARDAIRAFPPETIRDWAKNLGIETFAGSSGRVFPKEMKASPLLRAWLKRLDDKGAVLHTRHRWTGFDADGGLTFDTPDGPKTITARATVLALGGGSWPKLGSDAGWVKTLADKGVSINPLKSANCGFDVNWSDIMVERYAGAPLKNIRLMFEGADKKGDVIVTKHGLEGGTIYALSAALRDKIDAEGSATLMMDLLPDKPLPKLIEALRRPKGKKSISTHLKKTAWITGAKASLLREVLSADDMQDMDQLAHHIKNLPITLERPRPLDEVISTAGGISFDAVTPDFMLKDLPNIYVAGEMLDWEAPTGGYLLTACMAQGQAVGYAIAQTVGAAISHAPEVD